MESQGFCQPWIDFIEELDYSPLFANPITVRMRAEDAKKDEKKAIEIVARKLVNIVWAVWTYEKEFTMDKV